HRIVGEADGLVELHRAGQVGHRQVDEDHLAHLGHLLSPVTRLRLGACDSCLRELPKATMKLQKETESLEKHGKWYQDACGTAFAMELVGERWSMLIVRELMLGGRRFSDLRASLPGISAKVLTERLTGLEQAGVLIKR